MDFDGVEKVYRGMEGFLKASFPPRAIRKSIRKSHRFIIT